ncbi:hypothetical protein ACP70R_004458 [Stipagrostis hirtigluma subsp. patula]
MSEIVKEDFPKLSLGGGRRNYLRWASKIEAYFAENNLSETIISGSNCGDVQKAKALMYIRRHLGEDLMYEFLFEWDPVVLWDALKVRFDQLKTLDLIQANYDWQHLRFQDFDSVDEYNSALQDIVELFKAGDKEITEKELIEKTLSTFPPSDYILQDMYRKNNYGTYSELISALLLAEKQNQKLLENYYARPTRRFD